MNVLIVFAHPEPGSFSAALKNVAVDAQRTAYLMTYADRLVALDRAEPLFFHPRSDYDETQRLKADVVARSGVQWHPAR